MDAALRLNLEYQTAHADIISFPSLQLILILNSLQRDINLSPKEKARQSSVEVEYTAH